VQVNCTNQFDAPVSHSLYSRDGRTPHAVTQLVTCAFCGRENEPQSRYCIDCGKPISSSAARAAPAYQSGAVMSGVAQGSALPGTSVNVVRPEPPSPFVADQATCPRCSKHSDASLPFCGHCGARMDATLEPGRCWECGNHYTTGVDLFCSHCGTRVGQRVSVELSNRFDTLEKGMKTVDAGPRLSPPRPWKRLSGPLEQMPREL